MSKLSQRHARHAPPELSQELHAVYMPLALRYVEKRVNRAVCCVVSCCVYVVARIRLARDPDRGPGGFGSRTHARRFNHYAATRKKSVFRHEPLCPPQGRRGLLGACGRTCPWQTTHSGDISQRGRVGSRSLWCGIGLSLLRRNRSPEYRAPTGGTARCNSPGSSKATTGAHEWLQRNYPEADGSNGMVIVASIGEARQK
jgi:hypothetical protein